MSNTLDRAYVIDQQFRARVKAQNFAKRRSCTTFTQAELSSQQTLSLFHSQLLSRLLDVHARKLREQGEGFYTIGSSGHEGNAAIAEVLSLEDMAFLHYRSGAFMLHRSKQSPSGLDLYSQLLSLVASKADPISGGRHKVFGSLELRVPPQTSTIASHLPKSVGCALSLQYARAWTKEGCPFEKLSSKGVVMASFGDASFNHSTAQGALNAVSWIQAHHIGLPLIWVCEDNGIGISVSTPNTWVQQIQQKPHWHYLECDGLNLADVYLKARQAYSLAKLHRQPVFLHLKTVRLLGHAGSDIEQQYRTLRQIEAWEWDDPVLHSARDIIEAGWMSPQEIVQQYDALDHDIAQLAQKACQTPKLKSAKAIMASIVPPKHTQKMPKQPAQGQREHVLGKFARLLNGPLNLCQAINVALTDLMLQYPQIVVFGEDVAKKGGVYQVTTQLQARFGPKRVFDTLLDEQTILGTAIGFSHNGFIPIPEIQFLAYLHNAIDQLRGEAATLSFFSKGQFTNPMVIRIAGLGYQKGFGGHFHNDNAIASLREIPGIIVACPSTPIDGALMLKEAVRLAYEEQRVVVFLEPIALYMQKDLYQPGDHLALQPYPAHPKRVKFQSLGIEGQGKELCIISYGNGMHLSRQAARQLQHEEGVQIRLIDLRWLLPLNEEALLKHVQECAHILIVDEGRKTGSLSEQLMALFMEQLSHRPSVRRVCAEDCFIPLGQSWQYILPSKETILQQARALLSEQPILQGV